MGSASAAGSFGCLQGGHLQAAPRGLWAGACWRGSSCALGVVVPVRGRTLQLRLQTEKQLAASMSNQQAAQLQQLSLAR